MTETTLKKGRYPAGVLDMKQMNRALRHRLRNLCAGVKMTMERISATIQSTHPQLESRCRIIVSEMDSLQTFTDRMDLLFDDLRPASALSLFDLVTRLRENFVRQFPLCALDFEGEELNLVFPNGSHLLAALNELLENAADAAGAEGQVVLAWQEKETELTISIRNNGRAIPEDIPLEIPQPFHTPRSKHDGIGLAIAYRICQEEGMKLSIQNDPARNQVCTTISIAHGEYQNGQV